MEETLNSHCKSKHFLCQARDNATAREALAYIKLKYGIDNDSISSFHQLQVEMERSTKKLDSNGRYGGWTQTISGKRFYPLDPRPEDFDIRDIAWSLAHTVRFCGHIMVPIVVAQHSVIVSQYCDEKDALWGLLHDMSEAYICDIPTPLKKSPEMEGYRMIELGIMNSGCKKFGLDPIQPESVHVADKETLAAEVRQFRTNADEEWKRSNSSYTRIQEKIVPLFGVPAYKLFIDRYEQLTGETVYGKEDFGGFDSVSQ